MELKSLIKSCIQGDRESQRKLYDKYRGQMYSICLRYCINEDLASDALQEGFINVFQNIKRLSNLESFEHWIRKIIIRSSLEQLRKEKKFKFEELDKLNETFLIENESEMPETYNYDKLMSHLNSMPEGYRTIFSMFVLDDLNHNEISELLGIQVSTSRSQLLKARKYMQKLIFNDQHLYKEIKYRV